MRRPLIRSASGVGGLRSASGVGGLRSASGVGGLVAALALMLVLSACGRLSDGVTGAQRVATAGDAGGSTTAGRPGSTTSVPAGSTTLGPTGSSVPGPGATSPTTVAAPGSVPGPQSDAELAARLITQVPAGFTQQPDSVGDTGPSDLAKAVRDDPSPGTEEALRSEGFVRGYQRLWADPSGEQIIVFVYQFATSAGAASELGRTTAAAQSLAPPGQSRPISVPGLPPSTVGFSGTTADGAGAVVFFRAGTFQVQIVCNGRAEEAVRARVVPLAQDQLRRLA